VGTCSNYRRCRRLAACAAAFAALSLARAGAEEMADQVLQLVNEQRAANGLAPLVRNEALDRAALSHSQDMAAGNFMSHFGSDGSNPTQRIGAAGYTGSTWGENVAAWYPSAQAVMNAWMNSPGHRANILNPNFKEIGIAVVYRADTGSRYFWTQDFGARAGSASPPPSTVPLGTPQITGVDRVSGPSGTMVTLSGQNLGAAQGNSQVLFPGRVAVLSWADTAVTLQLFATSPGTRSLWIRRGDGQDTNYLNFTVE
jgi:Cysteine-rich secretory protein family/IPT/TIG domain